MCASVGVDPLASGKGFWAEKLGVGDFYYELAVQIVEVCFFSIFLAHHVFIILSIGLVPSTVTFRLQKNGQ